MTTDKAKPSEINKNFYKNNLTTQKQTIPNQIKQYKHFYNKIKQLAHAA